MIQGSDQAVSMPPANKELSQQQRGLSALRASFLHARDETTAAAGPYRQRHNASTESLEPNNKPISKQHCIGLMPGENQ